MTLVDAWPAVRRAGACGPFFELLRWDGNEPPIAEPGWHPMTDFADHPLGLASRIAAARHSLVARGGGGASAAILTRVAASATFLGVAARLLSPVIGAVLAAGVAPELDWRRLHWRPAETGVLPLATGPIAGRPVGPARRGFTDPAAGDTGFVFATAVAPALRLGDTVADRYGVPPRAVAGNVASALVGAVAVASRRYRLTADAGAHLAAGLLSQGELAGTGRFVGPTPDDPRTRFRRRSCCLLYRMDGAALCGDCVLHDRSRRPVGGRGGSGPAQ